MSKIVILKRVRLVFIVLLLPLFQVNKLILRCKDAFFSVV